MSFSPVFHSDCKKCNSIWWLLIASLYLCIYLFGSREQALLGVGGGGAGGGKRIHPQESFLAGLVVVLFFQCKHCGKPCTFRSFSKAFISAEVEQSIAPPPPSVLNKKMLNRERISFIKSVWISSPIFSLFK